MPYGTPTDPVAGTVITVAYAVANLLDPIRALRAFTGGADPTGANYIVTADSTSATSWKTGLAAIASVLGYTPVNKAGDSMSGLLSFTDDGEGVVFSGGGHLIDVNAIGTFLRANLDTFNVQNEAANKTMLQVTLGMVAALNNAAASGSFRVYLENGTRYFSITSNGSGGLLIVRDDSNTALSIGPGATMTLNGADPFARASHTGTQLASTISDIADVRVPDGAVVWFETLAELTAAGASWQRYTAADGRLLVGAGASASSQTFTQATNYGSNWTPAVGVGVSDTIGISDTVSWSSGSVPASESAQVAGAGTGGVVTFSTFNHIHPAPTLSKSGSVSKTGSAAITGNTATWLPYIRAGIWGQKI